MTEDTDIKTKLEDDLVSLARTLPNIRHAEARLEGDLARLEEAKRIAAHWRAQAHLLSQRIRKALDAAEAGF